jgi:hypothetical protein
MSHPGNPNKPLRKAPETVVCDSPPESNWPHTTASVIRQQARTVSRGGGCVQQNPILEAYQYEPYGEPRWPLTTRTPTNDVVGRTPLPPHYLLEHTTSDCFGIWCV